MLDVPEKRAVIRGIGISQIGRHTGIAGAELTREAAAAAIADAGLRPGEIDGISTMGETPLGEVARMLGVEDLAYRGGGYDRGGLLSPLMSAFLAVAAGRARHVLVVRTVKMMGGTIVPAPAAAVATAPPPPETMTNDDQTMEAMGRVMGDMAPLLACHAYSAANWLAMHCQRHMHVYGTTKEQLGWLAIQSRRNAALNPLAAYRAPMTMDDYLASRPVSTPFSLFDCDVPIDGSIALVVSARETARDGPNPAIHIEAFGGAGEQTGWIDRSDFPRMASTDAAADLWSRTALKPADVDIAELYDGFSFLTFAWLEALGLCGEGESGPFIEGAHRIALDGELPLNTYGGQLSAGRMHGYWVLHEACLQLRRQAGDRQVPGAPEVAAVAAGGGPIAGCLLLTT